PRSDPDRLPGRELSVHARGRDPDSLLPPRLTKRVKLRAIEELTEDPRNLGLDDARAVVLNDHAVAGLGDFGNDDQEVGKNARFLTGVEGVVHGFLDGREEGLRGAEIGRASCRERV